MADFSLKAVFGMDASGVRAEVKQLRKELNTFVEDYAKLGAGVAIGAFAALSKGAIELAGKLSDTAQSIGVNVISLQALEQQHKRNGIPADMLAKALEKTKAAVLEASAGNDKAVASLQRLGLSVDRMIKLPLDRQYEEIAKAAAHMKNENAAYNAVCDLFGEKIGPKFMASLRELGTEGLPAVVKSAREAGHIMETETIVALDRAGDAIDDFKKRATVALGNILINFHSIEGLKLLGMQLMKVLGQFGGGIVDAIVEGGSFFKATFSAGVVWISERLQNGLLDAIEVAAKLINKIMPTRFQVDVSELDKLRTASESFGDIIAREIAQTEPSKFRKTIGDTWDDLIKKQQLVVDALNKKDFGEDAKKLEAAGVAIGKAIKADTPKEIPIVPTPAAQQVAQALEGFTIAIGRSGAGYDAQSTAALQGVRERLRKQAQEMELDNSFSSAFTPGAKNPMLAAVKSELYNVEQELAIRAEALNYARRYGEDATRAQFGDAVANRSLTDLTKESARTASATEQIQRMIAEMMGRPV